jgi:hypothetical protein
MNIDLLHALKAWQLNSGDNSRAIEKRATLLDANSVCIDIWLLHITRGICTPTPNYHDLKI